MEGEAEPNRKAKRGCSRDDCPECLELILGLVITSDGFLVAYEVMEANTTDSAALPVFLTESNSKYGTLSSPGDSMKSKTLISLSASR